MARCNRANRTTNQTADQTTDALRRIRAAQAAATATPAEEEPMRRYVFPIPTCPLSPALTSAQEAAMTRALEQLECQNQLLVDLLGAVNSLTAAMLCSRDRG